MKKKGFTLIELLAVIVVLAIIVLIAVPKVTEVIEESEKNTIKNSAENLIKTVDMYLINTKKNYGVVDVLDESLNYSGKKPEYGKVEINKTGKRRMYAYMEGYCITKEYNGEIEVEESTKEDCSGFVGIEVLCTKVDGVDLTNLEYGDKFTCELGDNDSKTFYVLENNTDTVSLIMNMNVGSDGKGTTSGNTVAWCKSDNDNSCAADGALEYLALSTASWSKLEEDQISLPSKEQISQSYSGSMPTWLYENLNVNGIPYGYWTSTPASSAPSDAWFVGSGVYLFNLSVGTYGMGVRPVITLSKTQLG